MRCLIFLCLSIITFSSFILPQQKKEYSPKVEEFMNVVEKYYEEFPVKQSIQIRDEEIEEFLKMLYFAIADDPRGYSKYIGMRHSKYDSDVIENKVDLNTTPKFGFIIEVIKERIAKKYSKDFVQIITTPYFLRIRITKISERASNKNQSRTIVYNGKIEEVIKGTNEFRKGNNITFFSVAHLLPLGDTTLQSNKTYFIPLRYYHQNKINEYPIQCFSDHISYYPISGEEIYFADKIFGDKPKTKWTEFKKEFINKFIINK